MRPSQNVSCGQNYIITHAHWVGAANTIRLGNPRIFRTLLLHQYCDTYYTNESMRLWFVCILTWCVSASYNKRAWRHKKLHCMITQERPELIAPNWLITIAPKLPRFQLPRIRLQLVVVFIPVAKLGINPGCCWTSNCIYSSGRNGHKWTLISS